MPKLIVTNREAVVSTVEASTGQSLMEALRETGFDEVAALCGGCCSCASCHVYVGEAFLGALEPLGENEEALLEGSFHRLANSRLSCQIPFSESMDGLEVTVAPED